MFIFSDSMKISSIMEKRQVVEKERYSAMLNVVKERIEHTPWPQATVAHMQYGGHQEET